MSDKKIITPGEFQKKQSKPTFMQLAEQLAQAQMLLGEQQNQIWQTLNIIERVITRLCGVSKQEYFDAVKAVVEEQKKDIEQLKKDQEAAARGEKPEFEEATPEKVEAKVEEKKKSEVKAKV